MMPTPTQLNRHSLISAGNTVWNGPDYLRPPGANALAQRIEAYWRQRGFEVMLRIAYDDGIVSIRSNMINGQPGPWQAIHPAIRRK